MNLMWFSSTLLKSLAVIDIRKMPRLLVMRERFLFLVIGMMRFDLHCDGSGSPLKTLLIIAISMPCMLSP